MQYKSHLTAIQRKNLSRPAKFLHDKGFLTGTILDYGCGRGSDVKFLSELGYDCDGYDPHYQPILSDKLYDTVMCNFVLNVISDFEERYKVLISIIKHCKENAYVCVRNDVKRLNGETSKGTYQEHITLAYPILQQNSDYTIYRIMGNLLTKPTKKSKVKA